MASGSQTIYYPSEWKPGRSRYTSPWCNRCNTCLSCLSRENDNCDICAGWENGNDWDCESGCEINDKCSGTNTICTSSQAYCNIGKQYIKNHPDVGPNPLNNTVKKEDLIYKVWTAEYFNNLLDKLDTALNLGVKNNTGGVGSSTRAVADPENVNHPDNSLITAEKYNQLVYKLNKLGNSINTVSSGDVIKASHAQALIDGFNNAKFSSSTCDVCNTSANNG